MMMRQTRVLPKAKKRTPKVTKHSRETLMRCDVVDEHCYRGSPPKELQSSTVAKAVLCYSYSPSSPKSWDPVSRHARKESSTHGVGSTHPPTSRHIWNLVKMPLMSLIRLFGYNASNETARRASLFLLQASAMIHGRKMRGRIEAPLRKSSGEWVFANATAAEYHTFNSFCGSLLGGGGSFCSDASFCPIFLSQAGYWQLLCCDSVCWSCVQTKRCWIVLHSLLSQNFATSIRGKGKKKRRKKRKETPPINSIGVKSAGFDNSNRQRGDHTLSQVSSGPSNWVCNAAWCVGRFCRVGLLENIRGFCVVSEFWHTWQVWQLFFFSVLRSSLFSLSSFFFLFFPLL